MSSLRSNKPIIILLSALLVAGVAAALWLVQQGLRPIEARQNPTVVEVSPAPDAPVSRATTLEVVFDQRMDHPSVEAALTASPPFGYDTEWQPEGRGERLRIQPRRALEWQTRYRVTVGSGARNEAGRALAAPATVEFSTSGEARVQEVLPTPGTEAVGVLQPITVRFDRPVVESSALEDATGLPQPILLDPPVPGTGRWLAADLYGFYPDQGLNAGTPYEVTVSPVVAPAVELAESFQWRFITEGPRVEATFPFDGATEVARAAAIRLLFTQPMDRASVEDNFQLSAPGEPVPVAGEFRWEDDRTLLFVPREPLDLATEYELEVQPAARALGGARGLASPFRATFATVDFLAVESVQPAPGSAEVGTVPTDTLIAVQFNHPVVSLVGQADGEALPSPIRIAPGIQGEGEWLTTSLFTFRPTEPLAPSTEYAVSVDENLQDTLGSALNAPYSWSFTTEFPRVLRVEPSNPRRLVAPEGPIGLRFNQRMDRASTEAAFALQGEDGEAVVGRWEWREGDTLLQFFPSVPLQREAEYDIRLAGGARGAQGGATGEAWEATVVAAPLPRVVSTTPEQGATRVDPFAGIGITFNTPLDITRIEEHISLVPAATRVYTNYDAESLTLSVYVEGGLEPSSDYTLTVDDALRDASGQPLAEPFELRFETAALPPTLGLVRQAVGLVGTYNPYTPTLQIVTHRNISAMDFGLYRLSEQELLTLMTSYELWDGYRGDPAQLVAEWSVEVETTPNITNLYKTLLPPEGELGAGIFFLRVTAPEREAWSGRQLEAKQLLVVTPVNLTIKRSPAEVLVWATDMQSGEPVADLDIQLRSQRGATLGEGQTDGDGLLRLPLDGDGLDPYTPIMALALDGDGPMSGIAATDWAAGIYPSEWNISTELVARSLYGTIYSDRPLYRPGQTVQFRGVLRQRDGAALGLPTLEEIELEIFKDGERLDLQRVTLSPFGTFAGEFTLDEETPTGYYAFAIVQDELGFWYPNRQNPEWFSLETINGGFQVAEYQRPAFEVLVEADAAGVTQGERARATVQARYYFGGALADAPLRWRLYRAPYRFVVPTLSGYWSWQDEDETLFSATVSSTARELVREGTATLDGEGRATLPVPTSLQQGEGPLGSQRLTIEGEVSDVNEAVIAGSDELVVHAGEFYIGLSPDGFLGNAGEPLSVNIATANPAGGLEGGHDLAIEFFQREWYSVQEEADDGRLLWTTAFSDTLVATRPATSDDEGRATATFTPEAGGSYTVLARGEDRQGNPVRSRAYLWVADDGFVVWGRENNDRLDLVADKAQYQVGDVARILVPTPFEGMTALVTEEQLDIRGATVQTLAGTAEVLEIPITEEMIPNIVLSVVAVKGITPETPLPEFRVGFLNLQVAPTEKTLTIDIAPAAEGPAQPGTEATYTVRVTDAAGAPVQAEVSLAVVDKGVLALAELDQVSLLDAFYAPRPLAVQTGSSFVVNVDRISQRLAPDAKGGGGGGGCIGLCGPEAMRQDFLDTAFWQADLVTDEAGEAEVTFTLPDNLTTWTLTAQAVAEAQPMVGEQSAELVATLPLLVRPTLPRFFVVGDRAELPVTLHNNTDQTIETTLRWEATGLALDEGTPATQTLTLPAGGRETIRFPVTVEDVEQATVAIRAEGGGLADGVEQRLPVFFLTAPEVVATSGVVRAGEGAAVETIQLPDGTNPVQGELTLELAPSLAGATEGALDWIENYPYPNTEATASILLANAATARALAELDLPRADLDEPLREQVTTGIQALLAWQNGDGGWGWWAGDASQTWLSAYALLGLGTAQAGGFEVPADRLARATRFLERWLSRSAELQDDATLDTRAFVLYVLSETGAGDESRAVELFDRHALLNTDGRAFLLLALDNAGDQQRARVDTLASELTARAILSATGAHWEEEQLDPWALDSSLRSTALALRALVRVQPEHLLLPQTVRWLLVARAANHWETTQQSAWAVLALTDFMQASGELEADFAYEVALNDEVVLSERATRDNLADPVTLRVGLAELLLDEANQLIITRVPGEGDAAGDAPAGRLYYAAWLRYYLPVETLPARNEGISVARHYEAVDAGTLRSTGAAVGSVGVGDLVQVRLTVNAPNDLSFFTLEDPIPAGFEVVDPTLGTTALGAEGPQADRVEERTPFWFDAWSATLVRDEKVALFSDLLPRGTYEYTYLLRATVPGEFNVLPTVAYEHYRPEVYGRSEGGRFSVDR